MDSASERRRRPRFLVCAPLTVIIGPDEIPAYTHDMSENGVFFYPDSVGGDLIEDEFEFIVQFPPELTLSIYLGIRCFGRVVRREQNSPGVIGIAAQILNYSILDGAHAIV